LAWATSLYFVFGLALSLFIINRIFEGINGKNLLKSLRDIFASSSMSGLVIYLCFKMLSFSVPLFLNIILSVGLGLVIYIVLIVFVFRIQEAVVLKKKLLSKVNKIFSAK